MVGRADNLGLVTGPAECEVDRLGLVCAAVIRPAVVVIASVVTVLTTTPRAAVLTAFVVVVCDLWHLAFGVMSVVRSGNRLWVDTTWRGAS
jgi:hypothetical protein